MNILIKFELIIKNPIHNTLDMKGESSSICSFNTIQMIDITPCKHPLV